MKIVKFILNHKIVTSVIVLGVAYTAGLNAVYSSLADITTDETALSSVEVKPVVSAEPAIVEPVEEPEVVEERVFVPTVEVQPVPIPVLSTQEYAEKYLDLSGNNQSCLDNIVNEWPERFTEDVRENNIKALTVFYAVCSTGFVDDRELIHPHYEVINTYGENGAFFDSEFAKTRHGI